MQRRHGRLPNGFGSISTIRIKKKNKVYKYFQPRAPATIKINGNFDRPTLGKGTYKDYEDAFDALKLYNLTHYNIELKNASTKEIFDLMIEIKSNEINPKTGKKISKKSLDRYNGTFKNYYDDISRKKFIDVSFMDLQKIIDNCPHGYDTRMNIKMTYSEMYKIAKKFRLPLIEDISQHVNLNAIQEKSTMHTLITLDETKLLWENINIYPDVDKILLTIYTGLRPDELCNIKNENVHLKERYMIGGSKTAAGIDRIIPICESIYPIIEKYYDSSKVYLIHSTVPKLADIEHMAYNTLNTRFSNVYKLLIKDGVKIGKHLPHDGRHAFESFLDNLKANKKCIDMIMGHASDNIGDKVYNHKTLENLLNAVRLLDTLFDKAFIDRQIKKYLEQK